MSVNDFNLWELEQLLKDIITNNDQVLELPISQELREATEATTRIARETLETVNALLDRSTAGRGMR